MVTGAASGIGAATTQLFLLRGWRVVAVDVDTARLNQLYGSSTSVTPLAADLTDTGACDIVAAQVAKKFSSSRDDVAVLVNCAGCILPLPVLGAPWADVERQFRINTLAPMYLSRLLAPRLLSGPRGGSIVNISSGAAAMAWPYQGAYTASKAALEGGSCLSSILSYQCGQ